MSYAGTIVPVPLGIDGFYGNTARIPITGLLRGRNLTLENSQLEKEGGAATQNASALSSDIVALHDWEPDAATQRTIAVTDDGGVYRDTGDWSFGTTVIAPGTLTISGRPPHLVAGGAETPSRNRKLFLLTGVNAPRVGSGDFTTMAAISTPPADWTGTTQPGCAVIHEGRLFAAVGHTIYWSTLTDHENFTGSGSGSLPLAPGEGLAIRAMISARKMLVVLKEPRGIYIVDTSAASASSWRYDVQSRAVGVAGPYGAIAIPNDVLLVDLQLNVHLLSATGVERDAVSSDISSPKLGTWIAEQLAATRSAWAQLGWYGAKRVGIIACSAFGSSTNNRRLMVDFSLAVAGPRFTYSDRDVAQALMLRKVSGVERPYIGTDGGYVVQLDQSTRSATGAAYSAAAYTGLFQLDHTDLSEIDGTFAGRRKIFDYLEFELEGTGAYNLSVNVYIDGSLKTTTPLTFSLAGAGVPLGEFLLGTDRLGASGRVRRRRRLTWQGTRIGIEASNGGAAQTFKISRAFIGCRLAE